MYQLQTSTGFRTSASTVEAVVSVLSRQFERREVDGAFSWAVTTPHGTSVSDDIPAGRTADDALSAGSSGVEHAYGLLVRDHLLHATALVHTGLLRTR